MTWGILERQPEMRPYENDILQRMERLTRKEKELTGEGTLSDFANGHLYFGLHRTKSGWVYREWAPAAERLCLVGDFNGWNRESHPLKRKKNGVWEITLRGKNAIRHLSRYKVSVTAFGQTLDRIPLYARYVCQDDGTKDFCTVVWEPETSFAWTDGGFCLPADEPLLIYEAHVGMATEEYRVGAYREFADQVLPRVKAGGYNTVQLMAVMEHPYYGSFGYQVSNFFAASSRFGTPDDLKYLVNRAHGMGLRVLLDLVHSHAAKNTLEGINCFDGTAEQFFKSGPAGDHPAWGSKVFDYGKNGVLHFLLSNLKFWLEEYHLDGFRFDGVTSMLYLDHGLGVAFTEPKMYFSMNTDVDAVTYLQLATTLVRQVKPHALCVAEDMSAMPGMALPVAEGGLGFDYRLSMGLPDFYIKTVKEKEDGQWPMDKLCWELTARRNGEKVIAYAESHDQALVGDQTLMFRLAGAAMYDGMSRASQSMVIDRAMALHKMIRLITLCAGGEGYLNFMGNEFGHPEWIDFPREGNGWSYHYARRQWSLADREDLRYGQLGSFDRDMLALCREYGWLSGSGPQCIRFHQEDQILAFERKNCLFVFNFHPTRSQVSCFLPAPVPGKYIPVLSTDDPRFGGFGNVALHTVYETDQQSPEFGRGFAVYLPARTALVLRRYGV